MHPEAVGTERGLEAVSGPGPSEALERIGATRRSFAEAAVRLQERLTADQIAQAEANLEAMRSQEAAAQAEFENAKIAYERAQRMMKDAIGTRFTELPLTAARVHAALRDPP